MEQTTPTDMARPVQKMLRRDWLWLFAYPVYQIVGTVRHEASHALAVLLGGGRVTKFVFWPTWDRGFFWGYVQWTGKASWLTSAAPYLVDLLTFVIFYIVCTRIKIGRHWLWVNLYIIGLVSPLINSAYRYGSSFFRSGDLTSVLKAVPPVLVHAYFILTLALYVVALVHIQHRGSRK